ncbi:MAG: hypothetical protein IPK85_04220 [Gemmatimonadetes bacterium]|nr:hypothetical protein [Gemmatimonadota bacterium]
MLESIRTSDAAAYCIMDYWHFEGWFALRSYLDRNALALPKTVFPGIELRPEAPTNFRLNTHFLFDDALTDHQLREFLSLLHIGIVERAPSREAFIELARTYDSGKLDKHGFSAADRSDDAKMETLGAMTAKITRDSWRRAQKQFEQRLLVIQPYDTSDGLGGLGLEAPSLRRR